jgi:hypothetical protein
VAYCDVEVQVDTIPLRLLVEDPPAPRVLGDLLASRSDLVERFAVWLRLLQPALWEEVRSSMKNAGSIIDWEAVGRTTDLAGAVKALPPERVIAAVGIPQAIEVIGLSKVIETVGAPKVLAEMSTEQLQEELRKRQQGDAKS